MTAPEWPLLAEPEDSTTNPEFPTDDSAPDLIDMSPLSTGALPVTIFSLPLLSAREAPVHMATLPDGPLVVVPDENNKLPELPTLNAFALRMITSPEDDEPPAPLTIATTPPTPPVNVVSPAEMRTDAPDPLVVNPTLMEIEPAWPLVAAPDRSCK